jgi:quercetin dioxygenase-like cupin family protein
MRHRSASRRAAIELAIVPSPIRETSKVQRLVHFTPGARTAWHTHPLGQTIYVTEASASASAKAGR